MARASDASPRNEAEDQEAAKRFVALEAEIDIANVFFGGEDRQAFDPVPSEEVWAASIRTVDRFLLRYASTLLSDAYL